MKKEKIFNKVTATLTAVALIQPGIVAINPNYLTVLEADQDHTQKNQETRNVMIIEAGTKLADSVNVTLENGKTTSAAVYLNNDVQVKLEKDRDMYFLIEEISGELSQITELDVKIKGFDFEIDGQVSLKRV